MTSASAAFGIENRIAFADKRYGPFASTHEALGVALEEWHKLIEAVRDNCPDEIRLECLDLAAVLIRLHDSLVDGSPIFDRSRK